jgi:hypothetical protein
VAGIYNKALYLAERQQALELWSDHVLALMEGRVANSCAAQAGAAMKEAFLIAEINVPDVFNDECIRDLAATAKLKLTAEKTFNAFKNGVRIAVVNYLRDVRRPSDNKLYKERELLERAASTHKYEEVAALLESLLPANRDLLNERGVRVGWLNMYPDAGGARVPSPDELRDPKRREMACEMVARLCRQGGRCERIYGPQSPRNFHKRGAERWFIICLRDAYCSAGRLPAWTAHGDPSLTGPFGRMVKKCLCLVGEGRKISAVNQINTINRYRKAASVPSERQKLAAFLTAVHGEYENARWRAADLFTKPSLREVLIKIANKKGKINSWVLGRWLAKHTNRWGNGLRLEKAGGRAGVTYWRARTLSEDGLLLRN